ncbi:cytochrome c [Paracoccus limosus]|uniref:Cytochrome c n=1 Tax=Paracoccus limosus TaxID=913252 RepID=A0A844H651_9RHOB|nr:c-type cytochrome [Paracoccus limosus]MTH36479.1 cytochrome c [Paracoccus limosus]
MLPRFIFAAAVALITASVAQAQDADSALIVRGAYLGRIMDCAGCHMPRDANGAPREAAGLSGGSVGFEIPGLGTFWPSNLTPAASGLGTWSDAEIAAALTTGTRPDGRVLAPVMPWASYAALSKADLAALVAWLRALSPVDNRVPGPIGPGEPASAAFYRVVLPRS